MAGMSDEAGGTGTQAEIARLGGGDGAVAVTDLFRDHHLELVRLALLMVGTWLQPRMWCRTRSSGCTAAGISCASHPAAWHTHGQAC